MEVGELVPGLRLLCGREPGAGFLAAVERGVAGDALALLTAECGGQVAGAVLVAFRLSPSLEGCFASIEELYVEAGFRGRGVGAALISESRKVCALRDISYLEVQTDRQAAGFYEATGFEYEDEVKVYSASLAFGANSNTS